MDRKEMQARLKKGEDPLEISIAKWEDIAKGKDLDEFGSYNCALCYVRDDCRSCPVLEKTGKITCDDTPYDEYEDAWNHNADEQTLKAIAKKEVEFLKSLRK